MTVLHSRASAVLAALGRAPAVPLHEEAVAAVIRSELDRLDLPVVVDAYGNLIAHLRRGDPAQPIALVAHMDHPGLEILEGRSGRAEAVLRGHVAPEYFQQPVPVRVVTPAGPIAGSVESVRVDEATGEILLGLATDGAVAPGDFAIFDVVDFDLDGDRISMRAADDLTGCAAILLTLAETATGAAPTDVYGVFTRAEEIGLVGATLLASSGRLPPETIVLSLEASRSLPGAVAGAGPVIRVGDARRSFHPTGEAVMLAGRRRLLAADPEARVQRQLLSGGTCEGTTFVSAGYRTGGMAFPLGNYHNQGPDGRIAAEHIDANDFVTGVRLLAAAVVAAAEPIVDDAAIRLDHLAETWAPRLRDSASGFR